MNSSYKITLLVTIVLCGLVLGYYISLDDQNQPPTLDDKSTAVATSVDSNPAPSPDPARPSLRDSSGSVPTHSTGSPNSFTPPPAASNPPAHTSASTGSLLDRVNARVQGSNDPIAPPPAAAIPAAASANNTTITSPVTSDARSITTSGNPLMAGGSANNNAAAVSRNPSGIPDTGRAALRSNTPTTGRSYTIKSGDTLSSIAEQTLGSTARWNDIAEANPYLDPRKLKVGQVIRLPDPASANASASTPAVGSSSTTTSAAAGPLEYVVREGDTLSRIARVHYSDPNLWDVIYRANKAAIGSDPAGIKPGMKLFIPPEPRAAH